MLFMIGITIELLDIGTTLTAKVLYVSNTTSEEFTYLTTLLFLSYRNALDLVWIPGI